MNIKLSLADAYLIFQENVSYKILSKELMEVLPIIVQQDLSIRNLKKLRELINKELALHEALSIKN